MPAPSLPKPTPPQAQNTSSSSTVRKPVAPGAPPNTAPANAASTNTVPQSPQRQPAPPAVANPVTVNEQTRVAGEIQQPRPLRPQEATQAPPVPRQASSPQNATSPPGPQLPPASLSALSSLSSNKLPTTPGGTPPPGGLPSQPGSPPPPQPGDNKATEEGRSPASGSPKFASVKKSPLRFLPFILGGVALLGVIGFVAMRFFGGNSITPATPSSPGNSATQQPANSGKTVTLTYWGLWEPSGVMQEVLDDYQQQNPGVTIEYSKQSHKDYRERLQNAIATGQGPDVFRYHATWVPMLRNELAPLPSSVLSAQEYQNTFYPVAASTLQSEGKLVGIPIMYEGLALLYNTDLFATAGIEPPSTWAELQSAAAQLTIKNGNEIRRSGIALGNSTNVDHFSDILALLMLQNGADFSEPNSNETRDALIFYTNFQKQYGIWSEELPNSTVAFARGDAAMVFAPSWRIHEIKATNPELKFAAVPVPQLGDEKIGWATFWAEGVNAKSNNTEAAWKFLQYMSSAPVLKKLYAAQSQVRPFGELYPRVDMASELSNDPYVGAYILDAPTAYSWYMSSSTHDNGVNDQIIKYYEDAVTAILEGKPVDDVLGTIEQGTRTVLRQYSAE